MTPAKTAAATAVLLLLTACSAGGATPPPADTLVWATASPPSSLDIAHGFNSPSTLVQTAVLDTMVTLDERGRPAPHLATGWTQPDPASYLFTLRKGVRFTDGSPLTADDAAFSLRRHLDPKVASQAASYFTMVKKVEPVGDDQVKVTLSRPAPAFLAVSAIAWQIVPRKLAEPHPQDLGSPEVGTLGTGPYKVSRFSLTSGVLLERNEDYWGPKPALRRVEVKSIGDPETLRLAVRSGEIDGTADLNTRDARKWTGLPGVKTIFYPGNNISYLSLAVKNGPLADVHVRRAIAHAVNRKAISDLMTAGHGGPADALLPEPILTAVYGDAPPPVPVHAYDPAKAKEELARSGHPDGFTLAAPYASGGDTGTVMQAVAADLAKIGITLKLEPAPSDQYAARMMEHDRLGVHYVALAYGTPEPIEVLPDMVSRASAEPQGFNFSGYGSAATDEKLDALVSATGEARTDQVTDLLKEIADQVPYVPLFHTDNAAALNEKYTASLHTWTMNLFAAIRPAGR
ncbi:ABC transporter substrate-binding protein [Nonomuraea sp. NPDC023979]|uniref:ABC transporter substrate-binding protein n=1 Tax=Nonomuraea sp. NPDC023979 TaxID=3154796 RepID=UPI0033F65BF6